MKLPTYYLVSLNPSHGVQYVIHFPKGEKYVSILRNAEDAAAQAALMAERERLRALIHKQQADAALLTEADEGAALLARQRRPTQQPSTLTDPAATVRHPCPRLQPFLWRLENNSLAPFWAL